MRSSSAIVKFPKRPIERVSADGATLYDILMERLWGALGRVFNKVGVPGLMKDVIINDSTTGQEIEIRVGARFTRLSLDGRDYYFRRLDGQFDGTGMGCLNQPSCYKPG